MLSVLAYNLVMRFILTMKRPKKCEILIRSGFKLGVHVWSSSLEIKLGVQVWRSSWKVKFDTK